MGIFKKKKIVPTDVQEAEPIETGKDAHASPTVYDASTVIGGLGWYRTQYQRAMKLALGLMVALCISLVGSVLLITNRPTPHYFAATPDLRLAPLIPLDKPVLTQQGLLNWVTETITNSVSLDFLEWREKLSSTRENFEEDAFKSFLASLNSSGVLDMIKEKRLSVSAVATRAPVIIASGLVGGKATWKIEFPLIVSYESSQGVESTQHLMATVLVCRAPTVTTPRGVVIQQVVLKRDS
ncbi:DotI/IcmL/TraM family protein [Nitratidesulfovibrio vulgaris]|uniref:DotI/IcmL/TraM family protein n=1 Tax=Nitratidesulfovibrio vulgaris TaxID=881 RepID=UPI0023014613|nr:DotI/IcmL/TraM family protein [Nitratidesulfovibrio vulgaris]WCB45674.1 DotI/IcmL/TraM family protein [Nitratidesulfovibrio vulgaris]